MVSLETDDKGQMLILGSLLFVLAILGLTIYINTFIFSSLSDQTNSGNPVDDIYYDDIKIEENIIAAASPPGPVKPQHAQTSFNSFTEAYSDSLSSFYVNESAIYFDSSKNSVRNWAFGNSDLRVLTDTNGNSNWHVSTDYPGVYKASFLLDVDSGTDFRIVGKDSGGNFQWDMLVNDSKVTFNTTTNQDSVSVSSGDTTINITEGKVNGTSVNTFMSDLNNSEDLYFEGGSSVSGEYNFIMESGASLEGPCSSECIDGDLYQTGMLTEAIYDYSITHSEITIEKKIVTSSDIDKMVINNG